jgi:hypothetical protein
MARATNKGDNEMAKVNSIIRFPHTVSIRGNHTAYSITARVDEIDETNDQIVLEAIGPFELKGRWFRFYNSAFYTVIA